MKNDKFNKYFKNQDYDDINLLNFKIMFDSNWELVEYDMVYGGMAMEDVDEISIFYNKNQNKAIKIMKNHYVKSASIKKIPVKKLESLINSKKRIKQLKKLF